MNDQRLSLLEAKRKIKDRQAEQLKLKRLQDHQTRSALEQLTTAVQDLQEQIKAQPAPERLSERIEGLGQTLEAKLAQLVVQLAKLPTPPNKVTLKDLDKLRQDIKSLKVVNKAVISEPVEFEVPVDKPIEVLPANPNRAEAFVFNKGDHPLLFGFVPDLDESKAAGEIPGRRTYIEDIHTDPIYVYSAAFSKVVVYEVSLE